MAQKVRIILEDDLMVVPQKNCTIRPRRSSITRLTYPVLMPLVFVTQFVPFASKGRRVQVGASQRGSRGGRGSSAPVKRNPETAAIRKLGTRKRSRSF